jgi:thymidylate synthase
MENARDDYPSLVQWVREEGKPVKCRGEVTYELRDVSITLNDPIDSLPVGVGRKLNLGIAAAEALQLIGGVTDPDLMKRVQPRFKDFMDGSALHGAYGPRLRWQLNDIEALLLTDETTRQAVANIWDANYDRSVPVAPRDLPCTIYLQFMLRDQKLELHTHMRSNDVIWGVSYDFFQFTQLQMSMANALRVPCGPYHHHATSFHLYQRDVGILDYLKPTNIPERPPELPGGIGTPGMTWAEIAERARYVLDVAAGRKVKGVKPGSFNHAESWYLDKLRKYWVNQEDE